MDGKEVTIQEINDKIVEAFKMINTKIPGLLFVKATDSCPVTPQISLIEVARTIINNNSEGVTISPEEIIAQYTVSDILSLAMDFVNRMDGSIDINSTGDMRGLFPPRMIITLPDKTTRTVYMPNDVIGNYIEQIEDVISDDAKKENFSKVMCAAILNNNVNCCSVDDSLIDNLGYYGHLQVISAYADWINEVVKNG